MQCNVDICPSPERTIAGLPPQAQEALIAAIESLQLDPHRGAVIDSTHISIPGIEIRRFVCLTWFVVYEIGPDDRILVTTLEPEWTRTITALLMEFEAHLATVDITDSRHETLREYQALRPDAA